MSISPAASFASTLLLGGARSGKSGMAVSLAVAMGGERFFIATARASDVEMADRIARHQAERESGWRTVEEPLDLPRAIRETAGEDRVLVADCLTLWLSNLLLAGRDAQFETRALAAAVRNAPGKLIIVSNEVGSGIVPENALARTFRDAQGRLNQTMAACCDRVVLVTAGLGQVLKPSANILMSE
ncbi:MAG: bifunctional adenosylcobinamide kinase/adenosylcobinamide-phosphate guanylyltransferase [Beijerinckiaceae bacterium]